jgi:ABC-type multidrug transport system ATPase subunit
MSDVDNEQQTKLLNGINILNEVKVIPTSIQCSNETTKKIELIWNNLSYNIRPFSHTLKFWKRTNIPLLRNLSGKIESGRLTAIIGPSGAGKTTLIECLAGRRRIGVTGDIFVNGTGKKVKLAYNSQNEFLIPHLTIEETLLFASKLKNYQMNSKLKVKLVDDNENVYNATTCPSENILIKLPDSTYHKNLVRTIIYNLGLEHCAAVKVANCSGGQQKRLSIALELISSPSILILDEPTSGLDSVSCLQCVTLLRKLSRNEKPIAIAASIHQPTARILSCFDHLYILSVEGQCIYNGSSSDLISYLNQFNLTCPQYHNPADFITEIASGDHGLEIMEKLANDQETRHTTESNESSVKITKICRKSRQQMKSREFYKTWIIFKRCLLISIRDPTDYWLRGLSCLAILALISVLYYDSGIGKPDGCTQQNPSALFDVLKKLDQSLFRDPRTSTILNFGWIFFTIMFVTFGSLMPTLLTFPLEVSVFIKEYFNGWYSVGSYFWAKNVVNFFPIILFPLVYGCASFFITSQLFVLWRFLTFLLIMLILSFLTDGVGIAISAFYANNVTACCVIGAILQIPLGLEFIICNKTCI